MKQMRSRLAARQYDDALESGAFIFGYSDGWHGRAKGTNIIYTNWPNAYTAGYWEGKADRAAPLED